VWSVLADAGSGGSDNPYSLLVAVVGGLAAMGTALLARARRRRGEVDSEPIARRVAVTVEDVLQRRVRQLEREKVELERQLNEQRATNMQLVEALATLRAERTALMERDQRRRRGSGHE
jgi:hypothetical protein